MRPGTVSTFPVKLMSGLQKTLIFHSVDSMSEMMEETGVLLIPCLTMIKIDFP